MAVPDLPNVVFRQGPMKLIDVAAALGQANVTWEICVVQGMLAGTAGVKGGSLRMTPSRCGFGCGCGSGFNHGAAS